MLPMIKNGVILKHLLKHFDLASDDDDDKMYVKVTTMTFYEDLTYQIY